MLRFRVLNLVACVVLTVFNAVLGIWPMVGMNIALALINAYFLRLLLSQRHDQAAFDVVEVGSNEDYLRHVLRVHGADILRFQPDLIWDGAAEGRRAFLVLRGDETVGIVLIVDHGDGVANVVLDYVTPRYRDFSPGEFVWRQAVQLRNRGFRKVVTPPSMQAPYYERLGFRSEGDRFVLDL